MAQAATLNATGNNSNNNIGNNTGNNNKQCLTVNHVLQRCRLNDPVHVRRMNVAGSALDDITVMAEFGNVEVCSFSANDISDLEALRSCGRLTELHLRKNRINDFSQVLHLCHLPIRSLGMSENPISSHPCYRKFVISALPQLQKLDDVEVSPSERREAEREISDPFSTAQELGCVDPSLYPGAPAPSSLTQQQSQQQQPSSRPSSAPFSKQQQQQSQMNSPCATFDASSSNNNSPGNRYNGDDVPIGGGGFARPPRSKAAVTSASSSSVAASATTATATTNNTSGAINKNNNNKRRSDPFAAAEVVEPTNNNNRNNNNQQQQQQQGGFYAQDSSPVAAPAPPSQSSNNSNDNSNNKSEEAAVQAVKVLLASMSYDAVTQVKRYINTL